MAVLSLQIQHQRIKPTSDPLGQMSLSETSIESILLSCALLRQPCCAGIEHTVIELLYVLLLEVYIHGV